MNWNAILYVLCGVMLAGFADFFLRGRYIAAMTFLAVAVFDAYVAAKGEVS